MRQLGYDQSTIIVTREMGFSNLATVEAQFMGEGREQILSKFESMFWPDKEGMGLRSPGGSIYWKTNLGKMSEFMLIQDESTLKISNPRPIELTTLSCVSTENAKNMKKNKYQI